jgi:hypothetical protein
VSDLEQVSPPNIGGTLPHDAYIRVLYSIAKSLKRIADCLEKGQPAPSPRPDLRRFPDGTLKPFLPASRYDDLRDDDRFLYNRSPA